MRPHMLPAAETHRGILARAWECPVPSLAPSAGRHTSGRRRKKGCSSTLAVQGILPAHPIVRGGENADGGLCFLALYLLLRNRRRIALPAELSELRQGFFHRQWSPPLASDVTPNSSDPQLPLIVQSRREISR